MKAVCAWIGGSNTDRTMPPEDQQEKFRLLFGGDRLQDHAKKAGLAKSDLDYFLRIIKKQRLQDELAATLDVENYEQAAILRDELKELE